MIQAMGGLMSVTGERDGMPGGGPQKVGVPIVDIMTGMYAAVGVLAALARRNETGQGDYIDLAMLDVQVGVSRQPGDELARLRQHARSAAATAIRTSSRRTFSPAPTALSRWRSATTASSRKLCRVLGHPEWAEDERFATNPARVRNHPLLDPLLARRICQGATRDDLIAALDAAGVPCSPINTVPQVFEEPQVKHREMLRHLPHPTGGTRAAGREPVAISRCAAGVRPRAAAAGPAHG